MIVTNGDTSAIGWTLAKFNHFGQSRNNAPHIRAGYSLGGAMDPKGRRFAFLAAATEQGAMPLQ